MRTVYIVLFFCLFSWSYAYPENKNNDYSYFELVAEKIEQICYYKGTEARELLQELYETATKYNNESLLYTQCLFLETTINHVQTIKDTDIKERIKSKIKEIGEDDIFESALLDYSLALAFLSESNYPESFQIALYSAEKFEKTNNPKYISKIYILLGNICSHIRSYKMAEEYYLKAMEHLQPTQIGYYLTQTNIATALSFISDSHQPMIDSILNLIEPIASFQDPCVLALTYLNLANCYSEQGEADKANEYHEKSLALIPQIDNKSITFNLYQNIGFYYQNINNWNKALEYYQMAYNNALLEGNSEHLLFATSGKSTAYNMLGNIDSAYYYLSKYNELNNRIINNSKIIETYKSYVSIVLDSSQKELKIAEQAIGLKNRTLIAVIILSVALIIVIILILIIFQQKKQKQILIKENENKELTDRLKNEKQLQKLQKDQLEEKIREVSSYSLLLYNKNNIIQQVSTLLKQIPQQNKDIESINRMIESNFNSEQDWDNFILHFEKVHPDFFFRLKTHCNKLTNNNLRLCAYLRIGLSTKEICQILNVSPETIKSNRRRLKRLIGLTEKDSLSEFLESI